MSDLGDQLLVELSTVAREHCSPTRRHYCDYHQGYADAIDVLSTAFKSAIRQVKADRLKQP